MFFLEKNQDKIKWNKEKKIGSITYKEKIK